MGFFLFDFFKFLYEDTKSDLKFVADVLSGRRKVKIDQAKLQELKDWRGILKENWLLFLIVIAAFCSGYFFAQVQLNNACVQAVEAWVIENDLFSKLATPINDSFEFTWNITKEILQNNS